MGGRSILYPANNSEFDEGTIITINVDASDNESIKEVQFIIDGELEFIDNEEPYRYEWDTTGKDGTHTIKIKVFDESDNVGESIIYTIEIINVPENTDPIASFYVTPLTGSVITVFSFDASSCNDNEDASSVLRVHWDWENDGTWDTNYSTTKTATHQYSVLGNHTINLEVKDSEGLTHSTIKTVSVINATPTASFTVNPTEGTTATVFSFDASGSADDEDATSSLQVRWDWESDGVWDTSFSTAKTATYQFPSAGTYTINLEVKDTDNQTSSTSKTVTVTQANTPPTASFTIDPTSGTTATVFSFDATGSTDNEDESSALQVRWDWENDGTYDTQFSLVKTSIHQYQTVGTYTIKLQVMDSGGLQTTATKSLTVTSINTAPTASFTVSPTSGTTAKTFTFDAGGSTDNEDASSALRVRWDWNNDGIYDTNWSTNKIAYHRYTIAGTHTIGMEVLDSGFLKDATLRIIIVVTQSVTDIDGNIYNTVKIGGQVWMAENLKVTRFNNGDAIPHITSNSTWGGLTSVAYCNYNNDISLVATYGRLYNWYVVSDPRGVAPDGWHVPTDDEWKILETYIGMIQTQIDADDTESRGTDEGGKLKESGTSHWNSPNTSATNETNFNALPAGARNTSSGNFYSLGNNTFYWSTTPGISYGAWTRKLYYDKGGIGRFHDYYGYGLSIRCIKD